MDMHYSNYILLECLKTEKCRKLRMQHKLVYRLLLAMGEKIILSYNVVTFIEREHPAPLLYKQK